MQIQQQTGTQTAVAKKNKKRKGSKENENKLGLLLATAQEPSMKARNMEFTCQHKLILLCGKILQPMNMYTK